MPRCAAPSCIQGAMAFYSRCGPSSHAPAPPLIRTWARRLRAHRSGDARFTEERTADTPDERLCEHRRYTQGLRARPNTARRARRARGGDESLLPVNYTAGRCGLPLIACSARPSTCMILYRWSCVSRRSRLGFTAPRAGGPASTLLAAPPATAAAGPRADPFAVLVRSPLSSSGQPGTARTTRGTHVAWTCGPSTTSPLRLRGAEHSTGYTPASPADWPTRPAAGDKLASH